MRMKNLIAKDIEKCEEVINKNNSDEIDDLLLQFMMSYKMFWPDLVFVGPSYGLPETSMNELKGFERRLNTLLCLSDAEQAKLLYHGKGINIDTTNTNTVTSEVNISIEEQFTQVINDINENGYLGDKDKTEIIDKINEIKSINDSEENRVGKWNKLKPIFTWVTTKGVDIFLKVLPLIVRTLSNQH